MFGAHFTLVFCYDRLLRLILLFIPMLIGLVVPTLADPPQVMQCSSVTISFPGPPSRSSKRQNTVSRSSAEVEYRTVANGVAKATWLPQLLLELHAPLRRATLVYCNNISVVYMTSNPVQHQRTKHFEIDLHFVRERVAIGDLRVQHVPTALEYADIFTKGLPTSVFTEFRSSLNVQSD